MAQPTENELLKKFETTLNELAILMTKAKRLGIDFQWQIAPSNPSSPKSPFKVTRLAISKDVIKGA